MRLDTSSLTGHTEALAPLVIGAFLATMSGVVGNVAEAYMRRRERERSAALLFGEVLSTLRVVLKGASEIRGVGDRYGPVTRRMLHAARREIDIYERNREANVDLRDAKLRSELHNLALRIAMPLDGLLDSFITDSGMDDERRDRTFGFMMSNVDKIPDMVARLGKLARHNFDNYDEILRLQGNPPSPP